MNWRYETDPSLLLFTWSLERFGLTLPDDAAVLELGANESDFAERFAKQNPAMAVTGVDVRPADRDVRGWDYVRGNATRANLFSPETFDAVVMLGALEHFGLGFYGEDVQHDGDTATMTNVARWLKPGGWVYFDVPCNPAFSVTNNRHYRIYGPDDVTTRLLVPGLRERARGYTDWVPSVWLDGAPTEHMTPYHYVAVVADKR